MDADLLANAFGNPRHLVVRGNNRQPCFLDDKDREIYLAYLGESQEAAGTQLHAFVLMTNHVHLLSTGRRAESISRFMQQLNRRYSRYFNKAHGRTGTLYEGRYKSKVIDRERYFFAAMRYVERNPVRAGMVRHPSEYPWSSFRQNSQGAPCGLLTPHPLYLELGATPEHRSLAYQRLFELPEDDETLKVIRLEKVI